MPNRSNATHQKKTHLFITGDLSLVTEYASMCTGPGCAVSIRPAAGPARKGAASAPLPKGIPAVKHPPRVTTLALDLTNIDAARKRTALEELDRVLPASIPILTSAVTVTLTEQSSWVGHPERLVGIGAFPTLLNGALIEFSSLVSTSPDALQAARSFADMFGKESSLIADMPGMVMPRILCAIINEACFALGEKLASAADIDTAMKLGTNYPNGPLAWAEQIGPDQVYAVMQTLHAAFGDRYRPAPLLRQAALTGTFPVRTNHANHD